MMRMMKELREGERGDQLLIISRMSTLIRITIMIKDPADKDLVDGVAPVGNSGVVQI